MNLPRLPDLRRFVARLGWPSLAKFTHRIADGDHLDHLAPHRIVWYVSGDCDSLWLQVNVAPRLQLAVFAMRYRICSGWHTFRLHATAAQQRFEAQRLDEWVHRRWFTEPNLRREYRRRHPECAGWTFRRLLTEHPPLRSS
jgi:hypothetical protein